ncbi:MAG: hypothetical protein R3C11_07465 [Planctomycetaceae bacterium]
MIRHGVGIVSEDRKQGRPGTNMLYLGQPDLQQSLTLRFRWNISESRQTKKAVEDWMDKLHVKAHSSEQSLMELGRKSTEVAIARVMHQGADIYLFDEPTRGIDVGTKSEIYRQMGELAAKNRSCLSAPI